MRDFQRIAHNSRFRLNRHQLTNSWQHMNFLVFFKYTEFGFGRQLTTNGVIGVTVGGQSHQINNTGLFVEHVRLRGFVDVVPDCRPIVTCELTVRTLDARRLFMQHQVAVKRRQFHTPISAEFASEHGSFSSRGVRRRILLRGTSNQLLFS